MVERVPSLQPCVYVLFRERRHAHRSHVPRLAIELLDSPAHEIKPLRNHLRKQDLTATGARDVVCVHTRYDVAPALTQPRVEGVAQAMVLHQAYDVQSTTQALFPTFQADIELCGQRTIAHNNVVVRRNGLTHHGINSSIQVLGLVVLIHRHENGVSGQNKLAHRAPSPVDTTPSVFSMIFRSSATFRCSMYSRSSTTFSFGSRS